jgi:hypothetical protein
LIGQIVVIKFRSKVQRKFGLFAIDFNPDPHLSPGRIVYRERFKHRKRWISCIFRFEAHYRDRKGTWPFEPIAKLFN